MKNAVLIMGASLVVAGCGGGSDGQSVSVEATPIQLFSDGSGVGKVRAVSGSEVETGYVLTPELAFFLEELRQTSEVEPFDTSGISITGSGPNTVIRKGAISEDGVILNVLAANTVDEDAYIILFEEPTFDLTIFLSAGIEATNLPDSSTLNYSGTLGMQNLVFDANPSIGTFTATANFNEVVPTVTFDGLAGSYSVSGTAVIDGNSFSSTSMTINSSSDASMNGDFHGDGGNSMAGVIYSNDSFANYRGGFVGSQ